MTARPTEHNGVIHPTAGWMRSELERHGILTRGRALTDEQLARMLRALGVPVSAEPAPKPEQDGDR